MIRVDTSEFYKDWTRLKNRDMPEAIVLGFAETARVARDDIRVKTGQKFDTHTQYIQRGVLSIPDPNKPNQVRAAVRAFTGKYRDFQAAVLVRGATKPERSLDFMLPHEEGGKKTPHKGTAIAIPTKTLQSKRFKTARGRVKKRYQPGELLKKFKAQKKKVPGTGKLYIAKRRGHHAFLIRVSKGHKKKRKHKKPLEFLYHFEEQAQIQERWEFRETVYRVVDWHLHRNVINRVRRVP